MKVSGWMRGTVAVLGLVALPGVAQAQRPGQQGQPVQPGDRAGLGASRGIPRPLDGPRDVQEALKVMFMLTDANNDGLISKQEAVDASNTVIGGLFFRADADGDGRVSQQEARQLRQEILNRQPVLRALVQEARRPADTQQSPFRSLAELLDTDNDRAIKAGEVRQAVEAGIDAFYSVADTDRDGQMSPGELNAAAVGLARAAAEAAFRGVDADNNGSISQAEFEKAIVEPARVLFKAIDADSDGQVTPQEAQNALGVLAGQLRMTVPDARGNTAPIPDFTAPGEPNRPGQPARPGGP